MARPKLLIASPSGGVRSALQRFLWLLPQDLLRSYEIQPLAFSSGDELFDRLERMSSWELRDALVLCDLSGVDPLPWNTRQLGMFGAGVAAQLLLSFPEPYFVFLGCSEPPMTGDSQHPDVSLIRQHHFVPWLELVRLVGLISRHKSGFRATFDPTGIRTWIKSVLLQEDAAFARGGVYRSDVDLRLRRNCAVADEETAIVYLNAYCGYKSGFRIWLLMSEAEFKRILPSNRDQRQAGLGKVDLILSDWDLAFSDHEGEEPGNRLIRCANIENDETVLLITSFVDNPDVQLFVSEARKRRAQLKADDGVMGVGVVPKPHSGIFDLKSSLKKANIETTNRTGKVPCAKPQDPIGPHSLPFALRLIVERLLRRAARLSTESAKSVEDCVHRALLALEAKELLGGLSLTTYYEALAQQHDAEVSAEVSCFGIAAQIDAEGRLEELEMETCEILSVQSATGADAAAAVRSRLNFLVRLTNDLRRRFAEGEQIGAAERVLAHFAEYKHNLEISSGGSRILAAASRYVDWATVYGTRIQKLSLLNLGVVVGFGLCYLGLLLPGLPWAPSVAAVPYHHAIGYAFGHSLFTFLELQPGLAEVDQLILGRHAGTIVVFFYRTFLMFEIGIAYLHLGLLITMLYRRLTRHAP